MSRQCVLVLDFGGQYNQLIARRVRDAGVYCEIVSYQTPLDEIKEMQPKGIIFTGGPNSVYDETSPHISEDIFTLGVPVLGICYGCQLIAYLCGGKVDSCEKSEYGKINIDRTGDSLLFDGVPDSSVVWMSHTDYISRVPDGFTATSRSADCPCASMEYPEKGIYAVQFHPEVTHSQYGEKILQNFLYNVCRCDGDWKMDDFIESSVEALRSKIGNKKVVLGLAALILPWRQPC